MQQDIHKNSIHQENTKGENEEPFMEKIEEEKQAKEEHEEDIQTATKEGDTDSASEEDSNKEKEQDNLTEIKEKYMRLYAEFDNYRKRTAKEKIEIIQRANEKLILDLLPVVEDFERAEKSHHEENKIDIEGVMLIKNKLLKVLDQFEVKALDIHAGLDFDPNFHEAVTYAPAEEETLKGKIIDVIEKGYTMNETVIRYAKVVIGK